MYVSLYELFVLEFVHILMHFLLSHNDNFGHRKNRPSFFCKLALVKNIQRSFVYLDLDRNMSLILSCIQYRLLLCSPWEHIDVHINSPMSYMCHLLEHRLYDWLIKWPTWSGRCYFYLTSQNWYTINRELLYSIPLMDLTCGVYT